MAPALGTRWNLIESNQRQFHQDETNVRGARNLKAHHSATISTSERYSFRAGQAATRTGRQLLAVMPKGMLLTARQVAPLIHRSADTTSGLLAQLAKLGILFQDKSSRPYRYLLKPEEERVSRGIR